MSPPCSNFVLPVKYTPAPLPCCTFHFLEHGGMIFDQKDRTKAGTKKIQHLPFVVVVPYLDISVHSCRPKNTSRNKYTKYKYGTTLFPVLVELKNVMKGIKVNNQEYC